ncbi:hypothetical protein IC006_0725 [Sulfuracidifex tepidarius]|uniref:YdbS-like PH domain-containing protein n=2 Tax=Sulfuracidifex tepidarius TaxID=1294262 RepID=A0A510E130_9CREN|nr:hypothetical protein IC006_0725 [Sulfuracidifex tepidarius]BBG26193.1 hypothetical protein IC007_0698 [Sulfuracidifex tepidarius]
MRKTLVKGTLAVLIFSLFMKIDSSNILNYLIFLAGWYVFLLLYMTWKRAYSYQLHENEIVFKTPTKTFKVNVREIRDVFVSQGLIARKFKCGSVYVVLNGDVKRLWDINFPEDVAERIRKLT